MSERDHTTNPAHGETPTGRAGGDHPAGLRILLVEDHALDAALFEEVVKDAPEALLGTACITVVTTAAAACAALARAAFDVVVLDLGLPDSRGLDTLSRIAGPEPAQAVVVLTGVEDRRMAAGALRNGAHEYLLKGNFDPDLMAITLHNAVARHHWQRERKDYIASLAASEERTRRIMETSRDGIVVVDDDNRILFGNAAAAELLGTSAASLAGSALAVPRECSESEVTLTAAAGGEAILELRCAPISYGDLKGRVATLRDVTGQRRAQQLLAAEANKLASVLRAANDAIIMVDTDGRVTLWNDAAEQLFGYPRAYALKRYIDELIVPPGFRPAHRKFFARFTRNGHGRHLQRPIEIAALRADGSEFPAELTLNAVAISGAWHAVGVVRDITGRKREERRIQRDKDRHAAVAEMLDVATRPLPLAHKLDAALARLMTVDWLATGGAAMLFTADDTTRSLVLVAHRNVPENTRRACHTVTAGRCVCGRAEPGMHVHHTTAGTGLGRLPGAAPAARYCAPLRASHGGLLGLLDLWLDAGHAPDDAEMELLGIVAQTLGGIIERDRHEAERKRLSRAIEQSPASILITDPQGTIVFANDQASVSSGYAVDELIGRNTRIFKSDRTRPEVYQKLWNTILAGDVWKGELLNRKKSGALYWEHMTVSALTGDAGDITHFIAAKTDVTDRRRYEEQLEHMATHDPLTGLANRNLSADRLEQAIEYAKRRQQRAAVFFIDLDHFKFVNDSFGHDVGDRMLRDIAARLSDVVRSYDTVARQGGDEFLVIVSDINNSENIATLAEKILRVFRDPVTIDSMTLDSSASIGISIYPTDGVTAQDLLRHADIAMYRAKDKGRGKYEFFSVEMERGLVEHVRIRAEIREALSSKQFLLVYQPQIDLRSGATVGAEALIRWRHPQLGWVAPLKFIPIAEESGLILPIGRWVLRTVCTHLRAWRDAGLVVVPISINVSARQFRRARLAESVARILDEQALPPELLDIELTESLFMEDPGHAVRELQAIKDRGMGISMDDFGTGYSNLASLRQFPLDRIKIDRSFVTHLVSEHADAVMCNTVIAMCHNLGLKTLAEGVETIEQQNYLRRRGCDEAQGYLYSKPVASDDFPALLGRRNWLPREILESFHDGRGQTLLIVDTDARVIEGLRRELGREGHIVYGARDVGEAWRILATNPVAVVISDQQLPTMTGIEFLSRVRAAHPETVRIVISGNTDFESVIEAINRGAIYKFLTKPWDGEAVRRHVREACERYALRAREAGLRAGAR